MALPSVGWMWMPCCVAPGISPDLLELPDARVSAAHYGILWHVVARPE